MHRRNSSRGDIGFEADHYFRAGLRAQRIPHFRFAAPAQFRLELRGLFIARMHLHRKLRFGEKEFYEQREVALAIAGSACPFRGMARQALRSVCPAKAPFANRESLPVIQASPMGSARPDCSGKCGASESDPQGRGLKTGSSRAGESFTCLGVTCLGRK